MAPRGAAAAAGAGAGAGAGAEVRVCGGRACRRDGGGETWAAVRDLAGAHGVRAREAGCLGRCGAGPNLAVLPQGLLVQGVSGSGEHVARLLERQCGASGARRSLGPWRALQDGRALIRGGSAEAAAERLSEGLELCAALEEEVPMAAPEAAAFWRRRLLSNRSAARLSAGDAAAALDDARSVVALAPAWPSGYLRLGDCLSELGHCLAAGEAYAAAEALSPALARDVWHVRQRGLLASKEDCLVGL